MNTRELTPNPRKRMTKAQAAEASILQLIDFVIDQSEDTGLTDSLFTQLKTPLHELATRFGITPAGALMMSAFVNMYDDSNICSCDLSRLFGCRPVRLLAFWDDVMALSKKGFIRFCSKSTDAHIRVSSEFMNAVRRNEVYEAPSFENLTLEQYYDLMTSYLSTLTEDNMPIDQFYDILSDVNAKNPNLCFCKLFGNAYNPQMRALMLVTICRYISLGDEHIIGQDVIEIFERGCDHRNTIRLIMSGKHPLMTDGWIEHAVEGGMAVNNAWHLTNKAKNMLLEDLVPQATADMTVGLRPADKITEKALYFAPDTDQQLQKIRNLLKPEQLQRVQDRLEKHGMRRGVACIFYGGPGTGKTESVLQMARESGRGLMQVDISQMRDKYVGETEKRIKNVFDRYRQAVREQKLAPILFFNEADALFCKRSDNAERAVDKMENAMQNIILEEMETLDGILIATTNLATSMDSAFERRFLFKVEFQKPTPNEARHIWQAMLPELTDEDSLILAKEFRFSGGQIENIARKRLISSILDDENISLDGLRDLCHQESLNKQTQRRAVGFSAA